MELADGNKLWILGEGNVNVKTSKGITVKLRALHVPKLSGTLLSFGRLFEKGCDVIQTGKNGYNFVKNGQILFKVIVIGSTCQTKLTVEPRGKLTKSSSPSAKSSVFIDDNLLHRQGGHGNN